MMDLPPIPGESLALGSALVFVLSLLLTEIVVGCFGSPVKTHGAS